MKTNKMMRIASVLLVAVILTTCAISGTFAKYITNVAEVSDNARVAKFGVTATAKASDLFADSYKDTKTTYTANEDVDTITVQADTQNVDVFAPGTNGVEAEALKITGKPEVDVKVDYTAKVEFKGWTLADNSFYCPIVIKVNGQEVTKGENAAAYAANVKDEIEKLSATYHTNTDLGQEANNTVKIEWDWAFDGEDANDTYLGDQAAENNASTISIAYSATVTQID